MWPWKQHLFEAGQVWNVKGPVQEIAGTAVERDWRHAVAATLRLGRCVGAPGTRPRSLGPRGRGRKPPAISRSGLEVHDSCRSHGANWI